MARDVLITPASGIIEFKNDADTDATLQINTFGGLTLNTSGGSTGTITLLSSSTIDIIAGLGTFGSTVNITAGEGFAAANAVGGNILINGGAANTASNSATGGSVYITGGIIETEGTTNYSGSVYIDGGGSSDIFSTTLGSINIGTQVNDINHGTSEVVIGKIGTAVKLPGLGTSGFVKLGLGGELSAEQIITPSVVSGASSGTLTINSDITDIYNSLLLSGDITIAQPSGTPVDGQKLIIRLKDDGTSRNITWITTSGAFRQIGVTLPTSTTINKIAYISCIYNSTAGFWDVIAIVIEE